MLGHLGVDHRAGVVGALQRQVGAGQQLGQRAGRQHAAGVEQHQVVGQPRHLVHRVRDVDDGQRQFGLQPFQVGQDLGLACGVQRRQRLVHQQQLRAGGQRARDRHALAFSARQRGRAALHQAADAQQRDHRFQRQRRGAAARTKAQVGGHVEVREQRGFLDHVAQRAPVRRHPARAGSAVVLPDLAVQRHAARRMLQPGQRAQQRRLAAARRAEQRGDAAARQAQVDVEHEVAALQPQARLDHRPAPSPRGRFTTYSVTSTTIANATRPPASRCASANSVASTWS